MTDIITPPAIAPLPTPPDPNDRSTFNSRAYPWSVAQGVLATEIGAVAANVHNNAVAAQERAEAVGEEAAAAKAWAVDAGEVDAGEYSAKANASGTVPTGSAMDWASKTGAAVAGGEDSAKHHAAAAASSATTASTKAGEASDSATLAGNQATLASDWATKTGAAVAGGEYSAKHHATAAAASATTASTKAGEASASATTAGNQATLASEWAESAAEIAPGKHSAKWWADEAANVVTEGVIDDATTSIIKTWSSQKISEQSISVIAYDDRATLRSTPEIHGKQSIVDGLGLFVHHVGSDEPDDDETCFDTATGRWLLQQPHPDLLAAWALPDDEVAEATHLIAVDAHAIAQAAASIPNRIITAAASSALTTIAAVSKASFTAAVAGAKAGSAAFATPLGNLDARLAISARVTSDGTVTVTLNNPSAAASAAGGIPAAWQIFVFNQE